MTNATHGPGQTKSAAADLGFDADALRKKYREERDKRLRPDGIDQYIQVTGEFAHFVDDPYVEPGYTREPLTDEVDLVSPPARSEDDLAALIADGKADAGVAIAAVAR